MSKCKHGESKNLPCALCDVEQSNKAYTKYLVSYVQDGVEHTVKCKGWSEELDSDGVMYYELQCLDILGYEIFPNIFPEYVTNLVFYEEMDHAAQSAVAKSNA